MTDWTPEEDEAFNEVEKNSNLGKQILRDMGQPYYFDPSNGTISKDKNDPRFTPLGQVWPLYLPSTWVGLTEEELYEIYDESDDGSSPCGVCGACSKCKIEVAIARAIEAKLKEKNVQP